MQISILMPKELYNIFDIFGTKDNICNSPEKKVHSISKIFSLL
jgi:hypothetical protein